MGDGVVDASSPTAGAGLEPALPVQAPSILAVVIAFGSLSSMLSQTVVNVAIPVLEREFHAHLLDVQWILTAYILGLGATIPLSGWAADRFGAKSLYLGTLALFAR